MTDYREYEIRPGPLAVEGVKALHGANYFSAGPVIIVRLDLGEFDEVYTNAIPGFFERLAALVPSLREHHCSPGHPGGFYERVEEGTLLGHVMEHVAIELQTLAGMDVGYGKTRGTARPGVYNVVFRFLDEHVGIYTAKAAVNLVNAILTESELDVREVIDTLVHIREVRLLGPSTQAVVAEAERRGIPHRRLDEYNLVQLGTGRFQKRIRATVTSNSSLLAVETAGHKYLAARMLEDAGLPVPETRRATDAASAIGFQREIGGPVVVKPAVGQLGAGVTTGLTDPEEIAVALDRARAVHEEVVAQEHKAGETYRLLVIDHQFVAAARLSPPVLIGDGVNSVTKLIARLNAEPGREVGDKGTLTHVSLGEGALLRLADRGYDGNTVLREGESVALTVSGSLKLGGASTDVTDEVHPLNRLLAERASRAIGLDVAGVDVVAAGLSEPLSETGGVILGVSAAPDFRMHLTPKEGEPRNVAERFVDMLFPSGRDTRVPVFAVTGTAGATTAARLVDHCLRTAHYATGLACAEGFSVSGETLIAGDMTGLRSAGIVLKDTSIDAAVFEVPVRTILDRGLGYDFADIGIVLNVRDTGTVYDETVCLEDLAYAKSVVAEQVLDEGSTVLNADDEHVLAMQERLYSTPVLFSRDAANPAVAARLADGGRAVVIDEGRVVVLDREDRTELPELSEIPLAVAEGVEGAMDALLGAVAALYAFGTSIDRIEEALSTFAP